MAVDGPTFNRETGLLTTCSKCVGSPGDVEAHGDPGEAAATSSLGFWKLRAPCFSPQRSVVERTWPAGEEGARPRGARLTFLEQPPGAEKGITQWQRGQAGGLPEVGIQPPHQRVDRGVAEAEGSRGEHVGHGGVYSGVVALVGAHMLPEGLRAQDFGDIIPQGDDL